MSGPPSPDGHVWEDVSLDRRSRSVSTFDGPGGNQVTIDLSLSFAYEGITGIRRCRVCGQESVNGNPAKRPCDESQVAEVMER